MIPDNKTFSNYKIIRGHHSLLRKVKTNRSFIAYNIQSHLILNPGLSSKFTHSHNRNKLFVYDDFTYGQIQFSKIHQAQDIQNIVGPLPRSSQLFIHLSQLSESAPNFLNTQALQTHTERNSHKTNRLGMIQALASTLFSQKTEDQTIILSIIGFLEGQILDLLDFNKQNQKIKLVKNKQQTIASNMIQMIIKDLNSFMQVLGVYNSSKPKSVDAIIFKIQIAKLASGSKLAIQQVRKKIAVTKLYSYAPMHTNPLGAVLHELSSGVKDPISIRSSKLTLFLSEFLNLKTQIKVFLQINPQSQSLKGIINLMGFCSYIGQKLILRKNYIGNEVVVKKLRKNNLMQIKTEQSNQFLKFPRLHSLMTGTLSSVSKRRAAKSEIKQENSFSQKNKQRSIRKIYNQG